MDSIYDYTVHRCAYCDEKIHPEELIIPEDENGNQELAYHTYCWEAYKGK
jgi:hypothetical protein